MFDFVGRENISGVLLVGGDVHRTRFLHHHSQKSAGYRIPELITSPVHAGVIETANTPHPSLVYDVGEPNTFLLLDVEGRGPNALLEARFFNKLGETFYEVCFRRQQLQKPAR